MKIVLLALMVICLVGCESQADKEFTYEAWCKAASVTNLSFHEWETLKDKGLLPGQIVDNSGNGIATGLAIGLSSGSK